MPTVETMTLGMECTMRYFNDNDISPREFDTETVKAIQSLASTMMLKKLGLIDEGEAFKEVNQYWYLIENNFVEMMGYEVITKYSMNDRIVTMIDYTDEYFSQYDMRKVERELELVNREENPDPDGPIYEIMGNNLVETLLAVAPRVSV